MTADEGAVPTVATDASPKPGDDKPATPPAAPEPDAKQKAAIQKAADEAARRLAEAEATRAQALANAIRAVAGTTQPPPAPPEPISTFKTFMRAATLLLIALDVTAVALLASEFLPERVVGTFIKVLPAVFGTALVAYTDGIRRRLLAVADHGASLFLAAALLALIVASQYLPVTIPVLLDRDIALFRLDGRAPRLAPVDVQRYPAARSAYLTVRGLRTHALNVTSHVTAHVPDVTYHLRAWDLWSTWMTTGGHYPDSAALVIPTLIIATLEKPAEQTGLTIAGELPLLYRRWIADSADVKTEGPTSTISIQLPASHSPPIPPLPAGSYTVALSICPVKRTLPVSTTGNMLTMCQ